MKDLQVRVRVVGVARRQPCALGCEGKNRPGKMKSTEGNCGEVGEEETICIFEERLNLG